MEIIHPLGSKQLIDQVLDWTFQRMVFWVAYAAFLSKKSINFCLRLAKKNDNTDARANDSNEPAAKETDDGTTSENSDTDDSDANEPTTAAVAEKDRTANDTLEGAQEFEQTEVSSLEADTTPEDASGTAENKTAPDEETRISRGQQKTKMHRLLIKP